MTWAVGSSLRKEGRERDSGAARWGMASEICYGGALVRRVPGCDPEMKHPGKSPNHLWLWRCGRVVDRMGRLQPRCTDIDQMP